MPRSSHVRFHWSNSSVRPQFRPLNEPYRRGHPWWTAPAAIGVVAALAAFGLAAYVWGSSGGVLVANFGAGPVVAEPTVGAALLVEPPLVEPAAAPTPVDPPLAVAPEPAVDDAVLRRQSASERERPVGGWPIVVDRRFATTSSASRPAPTPVSDEYYVVRSGDTFSSIAESLGVDDAELARRNEITNRDRIAIGQKLKVPPRTESGQSGSAASRPAANSAALFRPHFAWPTLGYITTDYGETGTVWIGGMHMGLDVAAPIGDPVLASEAGQVLESGWSTSRGYGNYMVIDHGMGYRTLYGHLSVLRVKAGQSVEREQLIGDIGSTGVSSGPHLHFEVQDWGKPVNPIQFIGTRQPIERLKLPRILTAY